MERMVLLHLQSKEDETLEEIAKTLREYAGILEGQTLSKPNRDETAFRFYFGPRGTRLTSFNLYHSLIIDCILPETNAAPAPR